MMQTRTYLIIFVFLFFSSTFVAQEIKNKVMATTGFGVSSKKVMDDGRGIRRQIKDFDTEIHLDIGYYLSNNVAVGYTTALQKQIHKENTIHADYSHSTRKNINNNYSMGIFLRYQHLLKNKKLGLFAQLASTYNWGDEHNYYTVTSIYINSYNISSERTQGATISITPGVIYFITPKFSMETSMGEVFYNYIIEKKSKVTTSKFGLDFSVYAIKLGFSYYFGGRKKEQQHE
jgi:hypothetical protein